MGIPACTLCRPPLIWFHRRARRRGPRPPGPRLDPVRTISSRDYHGTLGGFVWALGKPLTMFCVLMGVFSFLFASKPTYKLDLIVGLFLWDSLPRDETA